jgi:uncharacterized protein YjiS (DUF1127 family)
MFLTSLLAWISGRIAARRDMRSLRSLSDKALADIGLTRGMIEGAGRRPWSV